MLVRRTELSKQQGGASRMPAVCGTPLYRTGHMMSSEGVRTAGRQRWMTGQWTADADATVK